MSNYIEINKNAWNLKTEIHIQSDFYENEVFLNGKNSLKDIELSLLGDIKGKSILHLQCHFINGRQLYPNTLRTKASLFLLNFILLFGCLIMI